MGTFGNAVYVIFKRPFIVLFLGLITPIFCVIDYFFLSILFSVTAIGTGNIFGSIVNLFQLVLNFANNIGMVAKMLIFFIIALIALALLFGLIFSGYINTLNNALDGKPKFSGEFKLGIKKYFTKISSISFKSMFFGFIFFVFMSVASIPSLVITRAAYIAKPELITAAIFINILTLFILFFIFMFFRLYIFFWYPAVLNFDKRKAFSVGKRVANSYFWSITGRVFAFDVVFAMFYALFSYLTYKFTGMQNGNFIVTAVLFLLNWVFKTVFFACFVTYVFSSFKILSGNIKNVS